MKEKIAKILIQKPGFELMIEFDFGSVKFESLEVNIYDLLSFKI